MISFKNNCTIKNQIKKEKIVNQISEEIMWGIINKYLRNLLFLIILIKIDWLQFFLIIFYYDNIYI